MAWNVGCSQVFLFVYKMYKTNQCTKQCRNITSENTVNSGIQTSRINVLKEYVVTSDFNTEVTIFKPPKLTYAVLNNRGRLRHRPKEPEKARYRTNK